MNAEKMRHAFEQFIIRRDGSIWVTVLGDQRSYNEPIERDFSVWCESRAAIEVELPKITKPIPPNKPSEPVVRRIVNEKVINAKEVKP